jgi:uncharacterized protein (DUF2236 family)
VIIMDTSSGAEVRDDRLSLDDETLFGPGSMTWRVHSDQVFAIGGMRALFLQALHPLAMAAVDQHRSFADDFWGRLERTTQYVSTQTFEPAHLARRSAARVRGIHRKLRGVDPVTGTEFRLDRPDLLLWVHCCTVDSLLSTARRAGAPIGPADADQYVDEQVLAADLVGIPTDIVPRTVCELDEYFREVRDELRLTEEARRGVKRLAIPPMTTWVKLLTPARPAWAGLAGLAFATQPKWARRIYRLPGLPTTDLAATGALKAIRAGIVALPDKWTGPPHVRQARAQIEQFHEQAG